MKRLPVVKVLLFLLNAWSTVLTLLTLPENRMIELVTGRYGSIRQRLRTGSINTDIIEPNYFRLKDLATPSDIAEYTFLTTPRRDPSTIGDYQSVCTNINTNTNPVLANTYADFWGHGPRRVLYYVYSISAPYCDVLNVKPAWRDTCVKNNGGNATACYQYVLNNFDDLRKNRRIRLLVKDDFGGRGVPFLRCLERPLTAFNFRADLLVHQTYWEGGAYHVSIRSSDCGSIPLTQDAALKYTLFEGTNKDEGADMLVAMPPVGWFSNLVSLLYSVVTLVMIIQGIMLALFHTSTVRYLPNGVRINEKNEKLRFFTPAMEAVIFASGHERSVITFKGKWLLASDVWISHWLYMYLSIFDALANIRITYVMFQYSTSLLILKVTATSLLFLFSAVYKIAWIMCLVQTFVRIFFKFVARVLRGLRLIRSQTREKLVWNIDGVSIFLTYRVYNVLLCVLTLVLLVVRGSPSFMARAKPYKVAAYGGAPKIAGFWGSEIMCDLFTLLGLLTVVGQVVGVALLFTEYRHVADNRLMRLMQKRYGISGWDGLMAADILGLDPRDDELLLNNTAHTQCSLGSLLQLMYMSGPSGLVNMAGDYIFHDGGFSKEPVKFHYTVAQAMTMGLFDTGNGSSTSKYVSPTSGQSQAVTGAASVNHTVVREGKEEPTAELGPKTSIFQRRVRVVSEGYFGRVLLVDATHTGQLVTNKETGTREFEVVDALTTMSILDIKWLLGNGKKLRIE